MKFIIQTFNGNIEHDFAFTLLKAIDYWNWKCPSEKIDYLYRNNIFEDIKIVFSLNKEDYTNLQLVEKQWLKEYCPIGSVEFVQSYYQWVWGFEPIKPKNVPFVLWEHTNRSIGEFYDGKQLFNAYDGFSDKVFVKCMNEIKSHRNGVTNRKMLKGWENVQVSDVIDIDVEYRCFVMNNELLGIQYYSGDFTIFPNIDEISKMIGVYSKSNDVPGVYTLDIGVNQNKTFVIEVHDFFSCGLYGFSNLDKLPLMFWRWHKEHIFKETPYIRMTDPQS